VITRPFARITGVWMGVPARVVTNHDLEQVLDTSDEWIRERSGIAERRWAQPGEPLVGFCEVASRQALAQAGATAGELDAIVVGTVSGDRPMPSTACQLQAVLGAGRAAAFDVSAACSGFLYALTVAEGLIASGQARKALVLGAEKLTNVTDFGDRTTAVLFADGAGAVVLEATDGGDRGILSSFIRSDGALGHLLYIPGRLPATDAQGAPIPASHCGFIRMAGREVFKSAVLTMAEACDEALRRAGVGGDAIDLLVPHQANIRIIESTAKHAGIPMSKVFVNVDRYGNTSAASIPLALAEAVAQGRLVPGMRVLLVAFGGGFTWGSALLRW